MQQQEVDHLCWVSSTGSGLGDRLINTSYMLTLARKMGLPLHMEWRGYQSPSGDVPHYRSQDVLLENMLMHMELPKDIVVGDQLVITPKSLVCSRYGDFIDSCGFYNEMVRSHFNSFDEFRGLLSICVRDFVFVGSSKCALKQVPKKMASIHLRRTDKVREGKDIDKHMIGTHELDGLNKITKDWIVDAAKTHNHFYICGDDDVAVSEYKDFVVGNRLSLFNPTVGDIDSWERTYIDLAVMSASKTIFQSQRNSSFSRFAAMLRGAKMINAYEGDKICI